MEKFYLSDERFEFENIDDLYPIRTEFPYKLFNTQTCSFIFVKIEESLVNLNDYLYYCNEVIYDRFIQAKENYEYALSRNIDEAGFIDVVSDQYSWWETTFKEVKKCDNIIILLSFLEGSLKDIYNLYSDEKNYKKKKKLKSVGKINHYLNEISEIYNYDINDKIKNELTIIEEAKKIRNIFTHEWDAYFDDEHSKILDKSLETFKITNLINSISVILEVCENVGITSGIFDENF